MMVIPIPSIDFLGGKPCRLFKGDPSQATFYDADPITRALQFQKLGAEMFHIVNLDGAFGASGAQKNRELIIEIIKSLNVRVQTQVGGGFRTADDIIWAFQAGIPRVILGTSALSPDQRTIELLSRDDGTIIADIGFEGDEVKVKGWSEDTGLTISSAMERIYASGFRTVVMTDKSRDGAQTGPNLMVIAREARRYPDVSFIISGGIGTQEHLEAIKSLQEGNITGFVIGKRLWAEDGLDFFSQALEMFA